MREEVKKYLEKRTHVIGNKSVYDNLDYNTELVIIEIKNLCERYNLDFSKVEIIGKGESSVVFGVADKVFKITFMYYNGYETLKDFVSYSQDILQVDDETVISLIDSIFPIRILLSKKLVMGSVTEDELFDMYVKLRDAGYLWADLRSENLGRDENGNLLLLDYGELININEMDEKQKKDYLEIHAGRVPNLDKLYKIKFSMIGNERVKPNKKKRHNNWLFFKKM